MYRNHRSSAFHIPIDHPLVHALSKCKRFHLCQLKQQLKQSVTPTRKLLIRIKKLISCSVETDVDVIPLVQELRNELLEWEWLEQKCKFYRDGPSCYYMESDETKKFASRRPGIIKQDAKMLTIVKISYYLDVRSLKWTASLVGVVDNP